MKLRAKIRYAVRILVEIGKHPDKPLSLPMVEEKQHISAKYARQILQPLEDKKIVGSRRGKKGGYFLKKKASEISLMDVMSILSENMKIAPCLGIPGICEREAVCGAKRKWAELQSSIEEFFRKTSIQDIIDGEKE